MPALERCHEQVVRALQKEGWQVVSAPFTLYFQEHYLFVDMQLSRASNGQREQIMLVEVKCCPDESSITREFYGAVRQYLVYQMVLEAVI